MTGETGLPDERPDGSAAVRRLAVVAAILLAEYAAISLAFDAPQGLRLGAVGIGRMGPLLLAIGTSALLMAGPSLSELLARLDEGAAGFGTNRLAWLAIHLSSVSGLFLTARAMEDSAVAARWLVVFAVLGISSALSLLFVAWAPRAVLGLLSRLGTPLALSVGFGLIAWLAGLASEQTWPWLSSVTLHSVGLVLGPLLPELEVRAGDVSVGTDAFRIVVAPVCSGIEGMALQLAFVGTWLWWARKRLRWPAALVLLPLAVLAAGLLNVLRIAALVLIGTWWSPEVAVGGFHSKAGWIAACGLALAIVALSRRWSFVAAPVREQGQSETGLAGRVMTGAAPWLLPLIAWLSVALLTGLLSSGVDLLQPLRHVAALAVLLGLRRALPDDWLGGGSWPALSWGLLAFVAWILLEPLAGGSAAGGDELRQSLAAMSLPLAATWVVARVAGSVFIVPVVEELAFRGYLMRRLTGRDFEGVDLRSVGWPAILVSSLAFAALHQRWLAAAISGLCFALAARSRGRLGDAILAHVVANGLVALSVLLAGRWSLWA